MSSSYRVVLGTCSLVAGLALGIFSSVELSRDRRRRRRDPVVAYSIISTSTLQPPEEPVVAEPRHRRRVIPELVSPEPMARPPVVHAMPVSPSAPDLAFPSKPQTPGPPAPRDPVVFATPPLAGGSSIVSNTGSSVSNRSSASSAISTSSAASTSSIDASMLDLVRRQALLSSESLRSSEQQAAVAASSSHQRWRRPAFSGQRTVMSAIDDTVSALSLGGPSERLSTVESEDSFAL